MTNRADRPSEQEGVLFVLDHFPRVWTSLQELEFRLCRALHAGGLLPVVVFSEECSPELRNRFASSGAVVLAANYQHGAWAYYRLIGDLARRYNVRTAYLDSFSFHGVMPWMVRLHGIRRIIHTNADGGVSKSRSWKRMLVTVRNAFMSWPTTLIITWSEFIRRQTIRSGVPLGKIELVYGGIDTSRFFPNPAGRAKWVERFGIPAGDLIISSIAFLKPIKRPEIVIEAGGLLAKTGIPFQLFMAGDGPMQSQLQARCRELGIDGRVHWLGKWSEPQALLQASDVFVLATVGEAFGFVVAEALACGVPVVAARSGAIPELVEEGRTGLLAAPNDPASFASAIERLAQDPTLRRAMAARGPQTVRQKFTVGMTVENTIRVFERVGLGLH